MLDKLNFTPSISYFSLPFYTFLRKCVVIRQQLKLAGDPKAEVKIRNLPVGSDIFYLCYPRSCMAQKVGVKRNAKGEIIAVEDLSLTAKFQAEVDDYLDEQSDPDDIFFDQINYYPTADPLSFMLYAYEDEKLDFEFTDSFQKKYKKVEEAIQQISRADGKLFVTYPTLKEWIKQHKSLYWSLQHDWNILAFKRFQTIYVHYQLMAEDLDYHKEAQAAMEAYQPYDVDWLHTYNRLYYAKISLYPSMYEVWHQEPFILKSKHHHRYYVGTEFKALYDFMLTYGRELGF